MYWIRLRSSTLRLREPWPSWVPSKAMVPVHSLCRPPTQREMVVLPAGDVPAADLTRPDAAHAVPGCDVAELGDGRAALVDGELAAVVEAAAGRARTRGRGAAGKVAVFGVPHENWGETPLAAVILTEPGAAQAEQLRDWINARVQARYQRVSRVVIHEDFPRSPAGKTLKRELRKPYWETKSA